jgi:hypothetical protein
MTTAYNIGLKVRLSQIVEGNCGTKHLMMTNWLENTWSSPRKSCIEKPLESRSILGRRVPVDRKCHDHEMRATLGNFDQDSMKLFANDDRSYTSQWRISIVSSSDMLPEAPETVSMLWYDEENAVEAHGNQRHFGRNWAASEGN